MSTAGDLQSNLEKIYDMMPLSERELEIAQLMFRLLEEWDVEEDQKWYGEKAVAAYRHIFNMDENFQEMP